MKSVCSILSLLLFSLLLSGCSTKTCTVPFPQGKIHQIDLKRKYMSCQADFYQNPRAYGDRYERIANRVFVYALMSSNAYADSPQFTLPGWERIERVCTKRGMSLDVMKNEEEKKIVLAFTGTDSIKDMLYGNFNIFSKGQYAEAEKVLDRILSDTDYQAYKIIATGHSLGGGLALHCSLYRDNIDAIVFNTSPRVFRPNYKTKHSYRIMVNEEQELLSYLRRYHSHFKKIRIDERYNRFNFIRNRFENRLRGHSIYKIARGLTIVAASTGNPYAKEIMNTNLGCGFEIQENEEGNSTRNAAQKFLTQE